MVPLSNVILRTGRLDVTVMTGFSATVESSGLPPKTIEFVKLPSVSVVAVTVNALLAPAARSPICQNNTLSAREPDARLNLDLEGARGLAVMDTLVSKYWLLVGISLFPRLPNCAWRDAPHGGPNGHPSLAPAFRHFPFAPFTTRRGYPDISESCCPAL
jgi:hypothetical protein